MQMSVYKVLLAEVSQRTGQRMFVNLECSAQSIAELYQRFQEDKIVYGFQLFTRHSGEQGVLEVVDRKEIILGREAVYKVEVPSLRFATYED